MPLSSPEDIWVVVKSRDVGEPAPRLCEAALQHSGKAALPTLLASAIWANLPGISRWASFDQVGASATASAKLHRLSDRGSRLEPCPLMALGRGAVGSTCTVLFVAHAPNASAPLPRKPYVGKIRRRERDDVRIWRKSARARREFSRQSPEQSTCPDAIVKHTIEAPRLYTSQGLRAALASSVCSRACTAARLRGHEVNRTRRPGEQVACLLGGEQAGCSLRKGNVLLVVSHWNADMRYLREQPFCYAVFEKHGNGQQHVLDFSVPNKANEASTYLHFLLQFFDELPETMLFLQDGRSSKHNPDILEILRHLRLDAAPYLPLNSVHMPFLSTPAFCHVDRCMQQTGLHRFMSSASLPSHQMDVAYTCCAQFLVTREAVRARPKLLYEALYRYALGSSDLGHRGDSFARGECLEVLWHVLFGRPRLDSPVSASQMCGSAAAGSCMSPVALRAFAQADDPFWSWAAPLWERSSSEERRRLRAGHLSPYDAAMSRGLLSLAQRQDPLLSSNCSLLEAQNEALAPRRKLGSTLRQTCRGGRAGGLNFKVAATSDAPLHDRALCSIYDRAGGGGTRKAKGRRKGRTATSPRSSTVAHSS